jgi:alpha-N-arabinofuranosidase
MHRFCAVTILVGFAAFANAQTPLATPKTSPATVATPLTATLSLRVDQPGPKINKNIYGHFAEHLGRLIYEGIWVGEQSPIPNTRGIRNDVVAALKQLKVPVLRWPGGCFADEYHWKDGIGPRENRPGIYNTHWGGVVENNHFGTHEFLDFCEQIGAEPYVSGNVGSGTVQEMQEWVEYMTSPSNSPMANLRRKNGREQPWKVPYFAVGNENWGCGGNMRPEYYADLFLRYGTFVKNYQGNTVQKIACGSSDSNYKWTDVLMSVAARRMAGLSLHYYTLPTGSWQGSKGSATVFDEAMWHTTLKRALRMDEFLVGHSAVMDKYDPDKKVGLVVDEWGTWYDVEAGTNPGFLYQQSTLRDAVTAGLTLNLFHKHSARVTMANIAQMVNVLQAVILTDKEKMILTPTYHAFEMYKVHQDARLIPTALAAPDYKKGAESIPGVSASASQDAQGRVHLSLVNLNPGSAVDVAVTIVGLQTKGITGRVLTAPAITSLNTFEKPDTVRPVAFTGFTKTAEGLRVTLPSKSVVVLAIE